MKVLLVEDEHAATQRLVHMLRDLDNSLNIAATLESVSAAVQWININPPPDLAFFDVQLADDVSFEIFKAVPVTFPVIFTTAYDQYILEALEHNSIDYLLKPISEERLLKALNKVRKLQSHFIYQNLQNIVAEKPLRKRFLVKKGIDNVSIAVKNICYFFTEHKLVFLRDVDGVTYMIDHSITDLTNELDHRCFFRANRKYLVNIEAIVKFKSENGKIILSLSPATTDSVIVSKENAPNFRRWVENQ
ncbi:response regulator transcription factor [Fulvivirga sp. M361]|uniref:LytR/AlgR family response regulator transcription factor n=1 Tax=Fulvivirga sp. M361 TaxID=2594266 RepID=UPI00117B8C1F|nr:LytTR family DNA-binding domain-containing protein [Fulvivirga sp. M361]TRX58628.1 response regulator transcription factor [Fulvivirga sp. M361]